MATSLGSSLLRLAPLSLLSIVVPIYASVVSTASCSYNGTTVTGSSCDFDHESAGGSVTYTTSGNELTFAANADAAAYSWYIPGGTASESLNATLNFATSGPERQGLVTFSNVNNSSEGVGEWPGTGGGGTTFAGYGIPLLPLDGPDSNCFGNGNDVACPITLGTDLSLVYVANMSVSDMGIEGSMGGNAIYVSSSLTAQFFEADGVTPVNVMCDPAPEPGSWMMIAGGLAVLGAFWKRYKQV